MSSCSLYSYDVSSKILYIDDSNGSCIIDQYSYQNSGPYQTYEKIIINFGPREIGDSAFYRSTNLKEIEISASITKIMTMFARDCDRLKSITVSNQSLFFESDENGLLYTRGRNSLLRCPSVIASVELSSNLLKIFNGAFFRTSLDYLFIPSMVEELESNCFLDSIIKYVEFSKYSSITDIRCFYASDVRKISLPSSVSSILSPGFTESDLLESITFPEDSNLSLLSAGCFKGCSSLGSISLPSKVSSIPDACFSGCSSLKYIFIPSNLSYISLSAFAGCFLLSNITLGCDKYYTVENRALYNTAKTEVILIPASSEVFVVPNELLSIGQTTLQQCHNLSRLEITDNHPKYLKHECALIDKEINTLLAFVGGASDVDIPATVLKIADYALYQLPKISDVIVTEGVKTLGSYCFMESSITSVTLPSTLKEISTQTFKNCNKLSSIIFPDKGSIGVFTSAFENTKSVSELIFDCVISSVAYLSFCNCGAKRIIFKKDEITAMFSNAFARMPNLESVELPSSLKNLSYMTFSGCSKLNNISFPRGNNVETIEYQALGSCSSLASFEFSSKLTLIDSQAFISCTKLKYLAFPKDCQIKELKSSLTFNRCTSLVNITLPSSVESLDPSIFYQCSSLEWIEVEKGLNNTLQTHNGVVYDSDENIILCPPAKKNVTIANWAKGIGERCFYGCSVLTEITFEDPSSVISVGKNTKVLN